MILIIIVVVKELRDIAGYCIIIWYVYLGEKNLKGGGYLVFIFSDGLL